MSDEIDRAIALTKAKSGVSSFAPSDEVAKKNPKSMVVETLDGLRQLAAMADPPERVEFRAPADANFGDAAKFIESVNELKHRLGAKGFHCRMYSEVVKENVWLFRYRPSKAFLAEKAAAANMADWDEAFEANYPPLLIPADIDKPVNTKPSHKILPPLIRGGTPPVLEHINWAVGVDADKKERYGRPAWMNEDGSMKTDVFIPEESLKRPKSLWERFTVWLDSWA